MPIRSISGIVMLACITATSSPSMAEEVELRSGTIVTKELAVGQGQARVAIPLPPGQWQVFRVDEQEMRMLDPASQHMAPTRIDVLLLQRAGAQIPMTIRVEASKDALPARISSLTLDNPCKRTDTLYRNAYDSGGVVVNCLLVNHIVSYLRSAKSGVYSDLRNWLMKLGIDIPSTVLVATFAQNYQNRFLIVTVTVNPATRDLDSRQTVWTASPFHRKLIAKDPAREVYVKDFVNWAEAYMQLISLSRPRQSGADAAGGGRDVPAFR